MSITQTEAGLAGAQEQLLEVRQRSHNWDSSVDVRCDLLAQKPGRNSHAWVQSSSHIPGASRGRQPIATCLPTHLCFFLPAAQPGGFSLFIEVKKRI